MSVSHRRALLAQAARLMLGLGAGLPFTASAQGPSQGAAAGRQHGLLVGVSRYPALPQRLWLQGPRQDVALMREALLAQGMHRDKLQVLVDEPRRADILHAMQALLGRVAPGDRVFFYFAGHGSQQPASSRSPWPEPDGLDEVLLPADAHAWQGDSHQPHIPNAIVDDEIGQWIDALVDRGAQVCAAFDTCHAAGMARADSSARGGRVRALHPAELGLPQLAAKQGGPAATNSLLQRARTDGRTLLFAGRAHERVREEWLPKGANLAQARLHGVFTWHLAQLIQAQGWQRPEQLIAQVRERFKSEGRVSPMPMGLGGPLAQATRS